MPTSLQNLITKSRHENMLPAWVCMTKFIANHVGMGVLIALKQLKVSKYRGLDICKKVFTIGF